MEKNDTQQKKAMPAGRQGKVLRGIVVKAAMKDTATVKVERYIKHPKYKKFMKRSKKFLAHDPGNTSQIGDVVAIREVAPISKRKRFMIVAGRSGK